MSTVAIIDYGRGNVRSVANALEYCGADAVVTGEFDAARLLEALSPDQVKAA